MCPGFGGASIVLIVKAGGFCQARKWDIGCPFHGGAGVANIRGTRFVVGQNVFG